MLRAFENGHALGIVLVSNSGIVLVSNSGIVLVSDSRMIRRRFSIPGVYHLNV